MARKITLGNDEFIHYIRKNKPDCLLTNDQLGKRIAVWLNENAASVLQSDAVPCMWGDKAYGLGELGLPLTAVQFTFDRTLLPLLYDHLDELAKM